MRTAHEHTQLDKVATHGGTSTFVLLVYYNAKINTHIDQSANNNSILAMTLMIYRNCIS